MPDSAPLYADLDFNSPLSDARAERLIATLQPLAGARVLDLGCGWAELLLRALAVDPSATGTGVDTDADTIAQGRANARERGLADRVDLQVGDAGTYSAEAADVALCVGASHAWGGTGPALASIRTMLRPGGRLLLGEGFWMRPPTRAATDALGGDPDEFGTLADLAELAVREGFRPLAISAASMDEWDDFESRYALGWERQLLARPDDRELRNRADEHRNGWLRGYRGILGFAYLTLGVPVS